MLPTKQVDPVENRRLDALDKDTQNIARTRQTREGLRTSEIRYRRLFESARDGILILDAVTLRITEANPYMSELLGHSRDEFLGKELWEIGFFKDKKASQEAFRELQAKGYLRYEDLPLQTLAGKIQEVEFVSNVYDEDGDQVIQCNIRDIRARKRAEEERALLLASEKAAHAEADIANGIKDEFLALLSHELRTPLTSILGWSDLLAAGNLDDGTLRRGLEIIVRNARAQKRLIDDLLDISRIITGKLRLEVQPLELGAIVEAIVEGLRPAADAKGIHLQKILDPNGSPICGDPERLQQVIWNLLTNAIKFTPKRGSVQVQLRRIASHVEITVNDTGQGIAPDLLPHVFDRFRQSDSSSTRRHGGLGLGLSIVRQLLELHGGTVSAESPGEGEGSTFRITLPMRSAYHRPLNAEESQLHLADRIAADREPSLDGLRVLVVDDEPDSRQLVSVVLTGRDAEVVSLGSAIEALEEIQRRPFDVLLSDIGMAGMDGYALITRVRQLPAERGGRIPAAALTAYAGLEERRRMLSAGYQMHIPKPVEPVELAAVVADLAERFGTG